MHIQPGLMIGAKLILGAATATTAGIYTARLAVTALREQGLASLAARAAMAKLAGTTPEAFEGQLATTYRYADPTAAVAAMASDNLITTMTRVRDFSFAQGLFGQGARSADAVGISFPAGKTLGDTANIMLRFDPTFMQLAADGAL